MVDNCGVRKKNYFRQSNNELIWKLSNSSCIFCTIIFQALILSFISKKNRVRHRWVLFSPMTDYSRYERESAIPEASSMIETFRAIGYSLKTAVADIVDNSIAADSSNIRISFEWKGDKTWLAIADDGIGMDNQNLINAMRPGSRSPLQKRETTDLGRFGLGLKTASFSQCRILSTISKAKDNKTVFWTWDLDFVKETGKWELLKYVPDNYDWFSMLDKDSGTVVIWNDIDRLVGGLEMTDTKGLEKFLTLMEEVKKHLSMVFHRFIEKGTVKIWFQDRLIEAWNPFSSEHSSTQLQPTEFLNSGRIMVKGYILPHKTKLSEIAFRAAEGPRGWNEQQGFYIYRNERMLLSGDWLGMFRKEEHYKLARIQIDLPNDLDADWQLDIKKSIARPPLQLRDQLKAYAGRVRSLAVEVYRHKGKSVRTLPGQKFVPFWLEHKRGDKWHYRINREHPLIANAKSVNGSKAIKTIDSLLKFIEETIPVKSIYIKESEESEMQGRPFESVSSDPVKEAMVELYQVVIETGKTSEDAKQILLNMEPFNYYPELIALL